MELLLIRHAEPVRIENETGIADPALTDRGRQQASRLADWLAAEKIDHIAVSPLKRARETAAPLSDRFEIQAEVISDLAEFDRDSPSYIPMEELRANRDPRLEAMTAGRWHELGPMVDPETFRRTTVETIDQIAATHPGERVAVVCHGAIINVYLGDVIGLGRLLWFEPDYTSVSRVMVSRQRIRSIGSVNERAHLR